MDFKLQVEADEMCEVGTTARRIKFDVYTWLHDKENADRWEFGYRIDSSEGLRDEGVMSHNYREDGIPTKESMTNWFEFYVEQNLIEMSPERFLFSR